MNITRGVTKSGTELRAEENKLRIEISKLPIVQKKQYYALEVEQVKDPDTYAVLNWIFFAGLHHFYLGKWQRGSVNLLLMILGAVLFFISDLALLGLGFIALTVIIELPQLFNSQNIVHSYNNQLMKELLKQVNT